MVAIVAVYLLTEIRLVEEDGLRWLFAMRTDLQGPVLVPADLITNVGEESSADSIGDAGRTATFGAFDLVLFGHAC